MQWFTSPQFNWISFSFHLRITVSLTKTMYSSAIDCREKSSLMFIQTCLSLCVTKSQNGDDVCFCLTWSYTYMCVLDKLKCKQVSWRKVQCSSGVSGVCACQFPMWCLFAIPLTEHATASQDKLGQTSEDIVISQAPQSEILCSCPYLIFFFLHCSAFLFFVSVKHMQQTQQLTCPPEMHRISTTQLTSLLAGGYFHISAQGIFIPWTYWVKCLSCVTIKLST